jgi:hypothetical protein
MASIRSHSALKITRFFQKHKNIKNSIESHKRNGQFGRIILGYVCKYDGSSTRILLEMLDS